MRLRIAKTAVINRIELPAIITKDGIVVTQSTVDYSGHYAGFPVAFDAKECKPSSINVKTNLKTHQVEFLKYYKESCVLQPKCFVGFIIDFYEMDPDHWYFLDIEDLLVNLKDNKSIKITSEYLRKMPISDLFLQEYFSNVFK